MPYYKKFGGEKKKKKRSNNRGEGRGRRPDPLDQLMAMQASACRGNVSALCSQPGIWSTGCCFDSVYPMASTFRIIYSITLDALNQNNVQCSKFRALLCKMTTNQTRGTESAVSLDTLVGLT